VDLWRRRWGTWRRMLAKGPIVSFFHDLPMGSLQAEGANAPLMRSLLAIAYAIGCGRLRVVRPRGAPPS
jgi:hypothetical protein